jgi:hypothetical protein
VTPAGIPDFQLEVTGWVFTCAEVSGTVEEICCQNRSDKRVALLGRKNERDLRRAAEGPVECVQILVVTALVVEPNRKVCGRACWFSRA